MKIHNFSAGPCILPPEVLNEAAAAVNDFNGTGLSLIEISHRSKDFVAVMEEARSLVKELLNLPDQFDVLFLQGGASLGFYTAAMNLLPADGKAAYVDSGTWSAKAIKEAKLLGDIDVVGSSKASNYDCIPTFAPPRKGTNYLHYTSNNTIFGTQFSGTPDASVPLVADMSSDIFSRTFDANPFHLIYAGAQKNMGPAGTVMYAFDRDAMGQTGRTIPSYLDLTVHASKDSMFNTPPVFPVYVTLLTLRWIKANGGVAKMQQRNEAKSSLIYNEIDRNQLFEGHAQIESRSQMNATFRLTDEGKAERFDAMLQSAGISGLKGHRSVGGYRASMYNALPLESVQTLAEVMQALESEG
ncbi:MAG: 3-phosphoserine/phosphohydroxythreonine transaminase [Flavobacteriales bacterium]|nr:3-phosphoserine/phosphohydroxythreonine transaminase [Flavobacteriales bacterium]